MFFYFFHPSAALPFPAQSASLFMAQFTQESKGTRSWTVPPPDTFTPSIILNGAYHSSGYAYEATYALFDYLFTRKGVRRIYSYVDDYNPCSQHLCEKLGMRREGLFRSFVSFVDDAEGNPVYENTMQYAILKHEWISNQKADK